MTQTTQAILNHWRGTAMLTGAAAIPFGAHDLICTISKKMPDEFPQVKALGVVRLTLMVVLVNRNHI